MKQTNTTIPTHNLVAESHLETPRIRYMPIEVRAESIQSSPHRHNYYVVLFFHKGGGTHLIDFVEYDIPDNSVHLIKPGQVHMLMRQPSAYGAAVLFSSDEAVRFPAVTSVLQTTAYPVRTHPAGAFASIVSMLSLLQGEVSCGNPQVSAACLAMLLLKSFIAPDPQAPRGDAETRRLFAAFDELVEQHYRNGCLPSWYAGQLNITEKKLNRVCKEVVGTTVSNWLKQRVLLEAKRLLSHSGESIKEIGYYLGFDDPAYFARFFAANAGVNASAFRKLHG